MTKSIASKERVKKNYFVFYVTKLTFSRVPNGLHPDQDRHSVGADLGSNYLQWLSADDKSPLARKVKKTLLCISYTEHQFPCNLQTATVYQS